MSVPSESKRFRENVWPEAQVSSSTGSRGRWGRVGALSGPAVPFQWLVAPPTKRPPAFARNCIRLVSRRDCGLPGAAACQGLH